MRMSDNLDQPFQSKELMTAIFRRLSAILGAVRWESGTG